MHFEKLGLAAPLVRALREEGYTTPTPIQAQAITPVMQARDVLGCAQTGTGKTAAFAVPILHRLLSESLDKTRRGSPLPRVLVLSPTRELATQIGDSFATYGRHTHLHHTVIFGGVSQFHQVKALKRGIDILVATPGRLIDLMEQQLVDLSAVRIFVLDEADRMLDMGFIAPIRRIAAALAKAPSRQTLLFSATMPPEIMHLADSLLHNPVKVAVKPVAATTALIEESLYMVQRSKKPALLKRLLADPKIERALVFTRTKRGADRLSHALEQADIKADAIHGNKGQNQRTRALQGLRSGGIRVLVATDVAARGIDVDGITHVFNYDLPLEPEAYVHRIGRTGRAGATGVAISFCDSEEHELLRAIERILRRRVPLVGTPSGLVEAEAPAHSRAHAAPARPTRAPRAPATTWHAPRSFGHTAPKRSAGSGNARHASSGNSHRSANTSGNAHRSANTSANPSQGSQRSGPQRGRPQRGPERRTTRP